MLAFVLAALAMAAMLMPQGRLLAQDAQPAPDAPLKVVIKPLDPFVMVDGDTYRGFSIDLWREVAARMQRQYEYEFVETVSDQLARVEERAADLAITGISITKEREENVDFSVPYFRAGLLMMTAKTGTVGWAAPGQMLISLIQSPGFLRIIGVLGILIAIMGHVFWFLERRRNPDFPKPYVRGVWEGIWYSVVTLVTVGYGDRTAKSVAGRFAAMGWMFLSLFLVANFTANITSRLTLNELQGVIRSENDLPGKQIATVTGSTAAQYLTDRRLSFVGVETITDAYSLLERGSVDVIVYDSPVLLYYANGEGQGSVQVVGTIFQPQNYGVAFPTGSEEREIVNRELLGIFEDGTYEQIYARWFDSATLE